MLKVPLLKVEFLLIYKFLYNYYLIDKSIKIYFILYQNLNFTIVTSTLYFIMFIQCVLFNLLGREKILFKNYKTFINITIL